MVPRSSPYPARPPEIWTFSLRTLTPLFIGSADPNAPVLSAAAVRGALRAWYRLLVRPEVAAGKTQPHLRESRLFGGAGSGEGQSLALVQLLEPPTREELAWNNKALRNTRRGLAYLGFSLDMPPNQRRAIKPGARFGLRLFFPRGIDEVRAGLLLSTLALWLYAGGLGSRSRRGFGALALAAPPTFTSLSGRPLPHRSFPTWDGADPSGLLRSLGGLVDQTHGRLRDTWTDGKVHPPEDNPGNAYYLDLGNPKKKDGTRVHDTRFVLWAGPDRQGWATAEDAHNAIGERFMDFRRQIGIDKLPMGALRMLTARTPLPKAPARTHFGLPLMLRKVGGVGPSFELLPKTTDENRAPSPLLFRPCPMGSRYAVLLTLLSGPWPGRAFDLRERRQVVGFIPANTVDRLPHDFLDSLPLRSEV